MKAARLLSAFFICICLTVVAADVSRSFAEGKKPVRNLSRENMIKEKGESTIILAAMPESRKQKPKVRDTEGGGLQQCMDNGYRSYYEWLRGGQRGDSLPMVAPLSQACDSCLQRNADAGRGWSQASYNCVSQCCQ